MKLHNSAFQNLKIASSSGSSDTPIKYFASLLYLAFEYSDLIWPWSGYLAVYVMVSEQGKNFEGIAQGHISLIIESPMEEGNFFQTVLS